MQLVEKIKQTVRDVQDYPKPGIIFKDITPVLAAPELFREIVAEIVARLQPLKPDALVAVEARGFIFGAVIAHQLGCRFIPVRKAGRLPFETRKVEYALEYGTAAMEMHVDAIEPGWRVVIHDDLLATGGTALAAAELVKTFGGNVAAFSFLINLGFLPGEQNIIDRFGVKPDYLVTY